MNKAKTKRLKDWFANIWQVIAAVWILISSWGDLVLAGERPGDADGVQGPLGAGVSEPDGVHRRDPVAQYLRHADLGLGRPAKGRPPRRLPLERLDDLGMRVADDQAGGVDHEVEVAVAVDVVDVVTLCVIYERGVRVEVRRSSRAASRKVPSSLLL